MQFALLTTVVVSCLTVLVSASPVPSPVQVEARAPNVMSPVMAAREPQTSPPPPPICGSYQCV